MGFPAEDKSKAIAELKSNEKGLEEFNKLKSSIDEQVSNLLKIKVTDETSMAVANQQLSKAKQLDKDIDSRHALVKEEALRFCQAADLAKRTLKAPLAPATAHVEAEILAYNKAEEQKKAIEMQKLADEKAKLEKEANEAKEKLITQMQDFEKRAFELIHKATTSQELSFVYTNYVIAFPAVYDPQIKERVMALGKAKLNVVQQQGSNAEEIYNSIRNNYLGVKQEIVAPVVAMPSFDAIESKIAVIQTSSAPTNIKKTWKHEVVALEAVPLAFLAVDDSKVKEFIKANSNSFTDGQIINGIKYYLESSVKVK